LGMRAEERQKYLLDTAVKDGFVSISKASVALDVSIETIRRDINSLSRENKLRKVRGGASPVKLTLRRDADYLLRKNNNQQVKMSIGMEAAKLITDGKIVIFDCGVSIQNIAACVTDVRDVTFITNSVPTMSILLDKFTSGEITGRVIMIGGEIDTANRFSKGAAVTDTIDKYCADIAFISCTALSAENVSSYSLDECYFSSHVMSRTAVSILIAESEKLGKNSVYSFAKITDFDTIITDDRNGIPNDTLKILEVSDTRLIVVPVMDDGSTE